MSNLSLQVYASLLMSAVDVPLQEGNAITYISQVIQGCSKPVNMQKHSLVFFLRMGNILTLITLTEHSASCSILYQVN